MAFIPRPNFRYSTTTYQAADASQTTFYPNSVPANVPCILIADPKTATEEKLLVTAKSTNTITVVRGYGGTTAQPHNLGATLVDYNTPEYLGEMAAIIETIADQVGRVRSEMLYAADAGSTDAYAITLSPAPSAYTTGMIVAFKAATANTGAATLNVNSLGVKTLKKNNNQDLETGDISASEIVTAIYDGTNFQVQSISKAGVDDWFDLTDGATINIDLSLPYRKFRVTMAGNRTLALQNIVAGKTFLLRIKQDATGGRTPTWWSNLSWAGGAAPTPTGTANKADEFGFNTLDTTNSEGFVVGQNI
jgi:hypothetical protein